MKILPNAYTCRLSSNSLEKSPPPSTSMVATNDFKRRHQKSVDGLKNDGCNVIIECLTSMGGRIALCGIGPENKKYRCIQYDSNVSAPAGQVMAWSESAGQSL